MSGNPKTDKPKPDADVEVLLKRGRHHDDKPGMKRDIIHYGPGFWATMWYKPGTDGKTILRTIHGAYEAWMAI